MSANHHFSLIAIAGGRQSRTYYPHFTAGLTEAEGGGARLQSTGCFLQSGAVPWWVGLWDRTRHLNEVWHRGKQQSFLSLWRIHRLSGNRWDRMEGRRMWTGYLVISSGFLTLESPTLGEGGNRGPWVNPGGGVGWAGQVVLCPVPVLRPARESAAFQLLPRDFSPPWNS